MKGCVERKGVLMVGDIPGVVLDILSLDAPSCARPCTCRCSICGYICM